ncbi:DNA methylase [Thermus phage phiLo]|nr:DNA methylase [Thermus phage phiLo]
MSGINIDLNPYYQVTALPSQFKAYPNGAKVFYRLLKTREALELSGMTKDQDVFRYILNGIKTEGFSKEDLLFVDFLFVSLLRNAYSGSVDRLQVEATCNSCGERFSTEVSLESVYMDDLDKVGEEVPVEGTEWALVLSKPTVGRYLDHLDMVEKEPGEESILAMALPVKALKNLSTGEEVLLDLASAKEVVKDVPSGMVEEFISKYMSEDYPKVVVKCPHCGEENKLPVTNAGEVLVKPFRSGGGHTG